MKKYSVSFFLILALALGLLLSGCGGKQAGPFAGREPADMSGYAGLKDYKGKIFLTDTTVKEAAALMDEGKSFVLFASFANCPFCNRLIPELCAAAEEEGLWIGYLNTRKNPAWNNNMDIDDYDLFVERFGGYLPLDANQVKHLYVPALIAVKDGKAVDFRQGVVEGADNPSDPLTDSQREQLKKELKEFFEKNR